MGNPRCLGLHVHFDLAVLVSGRRDTFEILQRNTGLLRHADAL